MARLVGNPDLSVALVTGAGSGIGLALAQWLLANCRLDKLYLTARSPASIQDLQTLAANFPQTELLALDLTDPQSLAAVGNLVGAGGRLDLCINTAGVLHAANGIRPERRLQEVNADNLRRAFEINAMGAVLLAQVLEPALRNSPRATFASLSARVGSISDNRLGGWYAYRTSKAALNMLVRTLAIEWARCKPPITCVALHPGTVATSLSAPYTAARKGSVFSAEQSAQHLASVIDHLQDADTGRFIAWDGSNIEW